MVVLSHPDMKDISLEQIMYALSDPTRLAIFLRLFKTAELNCKDFEDIAKKTNLSHHFKVMRENGLTNVRPEGRCRYISLRKTELAEHFPGFAALVSELGKKSQARK